MEKPLVFLSHATADAAAARKLREWLLQRTASVVEVFLSCDRRSLRPGEIWAEAIAQALDRARMVLVLTTSASERSPWVAFEAGYATAKGKPVIPLLPPAYPPDRLKPPLNFRHWIAIQSTADLGSIIEQLNGDLDANFPAEASTNDLETLFSEVREHWVLEATPLMSREALYEEIAKRVRKAKRHEHIQVTSTLPHQVNEPDPSFEKYISAVAEKCADAKKHDDIADYTVVMAYKLNPDRTPPPDRVEAIRFRQKAFAIVGATDRMKILHIDDYWLIDVMTIGYDNGLIAFPGRRNDPKLRHAIWIYGHDFVSLLNEWFELCVKPRCNVVDPETLKASESVGA